MHHVVRRGMEAHQHISQKVATMEDFNPPTWGIVLVALTALVWVIASTATEYTFSRLIPALVMVESTQVVLYEPLEKSDDPDATLDSKVEQELLLVKQAPITSSFRSTLKHLRSVGGLRARFRGFRVFAVTGVAAIWINQWISYFLPFMPFGTSEILTAVLLANLSMTWTHVVMSAPSEKAWFRRVPSFQAWKKVAGPTAICAFAQQLAVLLPVGLLVWMDLENISKEDAKKLSKHDRDMVVLKSIAVILATLFMVVMVSFPATVVLTRVQASLLAEDQETIVPFDRTFNGKAPEFDGVIGLVEAWKTFHPSSRMRLIKTYIKSFFIQVALAMFFFGVLAAEVVMILGLDNIMQLGRKAIDPTVDEVRILPIDN